MDCRSCSASLPEGAAFCLKCGARVESAPAEGDPLLGRALANTYTIRRKLGEGGFGAVYEAQEPRFERKVAIKTLHRHLTQNREVVERFRREGLAASRLEHPNAVKVYDSGETEDGFLWIAMEFL